MLVISEKDDPESIRITLDSLWCRYKETRNPVYAMYAFRHCFQRNVVPPGWVMQYVAVSFHDYLSNGGKERGLDACFQVSVGRGQTPPLKLFLIDERNDQIARDIFKLVTLFGVSEFDAAYMVTEKLAASDWNKTGYDLETISADTALDEYRKIRRAVLVAQLAEAGIDYASLVTEDEKSEFLKTFPQHSLPVGLK